MSIEQKTADTILENPLTIEIGGIKYKVSPPTTATLIEVSKHISTIPDFEITEEKGDIINALSAAKDAECLGDVLAILILGKKGLYETEVREWFFGLVKRETIIDKKAQLSAFLLEETTPKFIFETLVKILETFEIGFFLQTIIFLKEVNLIKKTKS